MRQANKKQETGIKKVVEHNLGILLLVIEHKHREQNKTNANLKEEQKLPRTKIILSHAKAKARSSVHVLNDMNHADLKSYI